MHAATIVIADHMRLNARVDSIFSTGNSQYGLIFYQMFANYANDILSLYCSCFYDDFNEPVFLSREASTSAFQSQLEEHINSVLYDELVFDENWPTTDYTVQCFISSGVLDKVLIETVAWLGSVFYKGAEYVNLKILPGIPCSASAIIEVKWRPK